MENDANKGEGRVRKIDDSFDGCFLAATIMIKTTLKTRNRKRPDAWMHCMQHDANDTDNMRRRRRINDHFVANQVIIGNND